MKRIVRVDGREARLEWTGIENAIKASLGGQAGIDLDVHEVEKGVYSVMLNHRSYEVRVLRNRDGWHVEIGGRSLAVEVEDPREAKSRRKGQGGEGRRDITSPMPGKVVRVLVAQGDVVEEGQGLVVVEAMKMQNEMKAPKAGTVIALAARAGASVTAGEVLVTLE